MNKIPFNKAFIVGNELVYISQAVLKGHISGNGYFTKKCHDFLENMLNGSKVFLTTSGTTSLEMAALLCDIKPEDEVILPSFTYVTTANSFYIHGAKLKFVDIREDTLNINEDLIESQITKKTKIICPVHYIGVGCNMEKIKEIAKKYNLLIMEDAAHAFNAKYNDKYLGTIGDFGIFSFHETKNIIAGEGGALIVNNNIFKERSEIIWEKGTNRKSFLRGLEDKYTWVDVGSSFYPSELIAAFLFAQLEEMQKIIHKRISLWNYYYEQLKSLEVKGYLKLPHIPSNCEHNGHIFYLLLNSMEERDRLLIFLRSHDINAVFHFIPLHSSPMGKKMGYKASDLPVTEDISQRIIRLPMFFELSQEEQDFVVKKTFHFFS